MTTTTRPLGVGQRTAHDPGDPLVTSHCPFCGSGQVVGRSDGTIGCDFCGQNYIVRVQPSFPGMPQMPMGPGAPSDVGPDGGLVDPGMIGPDGMPADGGGPPPGEDAEPGDGPQDDSPDGGDFPPPGGDSDDDATGSAPPGKGDPPKSKGKSKKGSRRYHGLEGQALTEDQLLRHLAVRVSGASPRVMSRLRAEGSRRSAAYDDGEPGGAHAWRSLIGGLNGYQMHVQGGEHHVMVGQHPGTGHWFASIHPAAPEHQHMAHMVSLGAGGENVRDRAQAAINTPQAIHFMDTTTGRRSRNGSLRKRAAAPAYPYRTLDTGHHVSIGRSGPDWYGTVAHPESSQVHYMHLGQGDRPDQEAERQLGSAATRSFIHATTPARYYGDLPSGRPTSERGITPQWYRGPGAGTYTDPGFHASLAGVTGGR